MSETVRADLGALADMLTRLSVFDAEMPSIAADTGRRLAQALAQANGAVAQRNGELQRAEAALRACRGARPPVDCSSLGTAVARAQQRLASARQAASRLEQAVSAHQSAQARLLREISALTGAGRQLLLRQRENLERYLVAGHAAAVGTAAAIGPPAGLGSPPPSAYPSGVTTTAPSPTGLRVPPGLPGGFALVPLSAIDDSASPVHGPGDFGKGYSVDDLEWSYRALDDVVLPALAQGLGRDHFAELDAEQDLMGTRSYSMCYHGFFDRNDAITLNRRPSGYRVGNGHHRIWLARQLGLDAIPAYVGRQTGEGED